MAKVNIKQTLEEAANLKQQIATLEELLSSKKKILSKYFSVTGKSSINSGATTAFVQTKVSVVYDIPKLQERLTEEQQNSIIEKNYVVQEWDDFVKLCKKHGISSKELKPLIFVDKRVNKEKLDELYEKGEVSIQDLEGCYTAKVVKSVALRLSTANGQREHIPASEE